MDKASSKPVEGASSMARFLCIVDEAAMYGAATTPPSTSGLTPAQQQALAPYLETDPSDGSKYYDLPATDPKEKGAIMGTTIKSPGYIAAIKQDQGKVIQQLLRQLDPKNQVKEPQVTTTPLSDEETAQALAAMKENTLSKFLSIVKKNDVKILNEGANPHKVSLPVQMAMQHYQQPTTPARPVGRTSTFGKYFHKVETEVNEAVAKEQAHKRQLINQYASVIAERVLMKENEMPGNHSLGFKPGPGPGIQSAVAEAPIAMDPNEPNNPTIHSHQKANPMNLKGRIQQVRNQLRDLANMAESNDLATWERICQLSKGGMFMGLEQNMEQVRHGIAELAANRKKGGIASRGIDKTIGEAVTPAIKPVKPKAVKPKAKTSVCRAGQVQTGVQSKNGMTVPKCSVKKVL
jgi:hypothetical protein